MSRSYTQFAEVFKRKAAGYTSVDQVMFAIDDINATLTAMRDAGVSPTQGGVSPYVEKLHCELDIMRDRLAELQRKPSVEMQLRAACERLEAIGRWAVQIKRATLSGYVFEVASTIEQLSEYPRR